MKHLTRTLCRLLIVLMAWTPFQLSHAGMIGTTDQIAVTTSTADRNAVVALITRDDIARELQSFGVDPASAQERVAAMSDAEVASLKGQLEMAPAGASAGWVVVILVGVILWLVFWRRA
ncbi:MAG TPA: PA2779 family protein [Burkholderiales bacterium]|nr:PA2779 family protein [Burkholderiales bacterium]